MSEKLVFGADLADLLGSVESGSNDHIETLVKFGSMAMNIRAVFRKRTGKIVPNCWLHTISEDACTTKPLCHFPLVPKTYQTQYGGSNSAWFYKTFKTQWEELSKKMEDRLRDDGSSSATDVAEGVLGGKEEPPPF